MAVITISRQTGSGGLNMAKELARKLDMEVVDKQLIRDIACKADVKESQVEQYDEKVSTPVKRFLAELFSGRITIPPIMPSGIPMTPPTYPDISIDNTLDENEYLVHVQSTIYHLANRGGVIIVGRGAQVLLADQPKTLHLKVVAPEDVRIKRIATLGLAGADDPAAYVKKTDKQRDGYVRRYYETDPEDPTLYHLTLNTHALGLNAAVELAARAFEDLVTD